MSSVPRGASGADVSHPNKPDPDFQFPPKGCFELAQLVSRSSFSLYLHTESQPTSIVSIFTGGAPASGKFGSPGVPPTFLEATQLSGLELAVS